MTLIDKGYYDYDYEPLPPVPVDAAQTVMSDEKLNTMMNKFGFGRKSDAEKMQEQAMKEIGDNK